MTAIEIVYVAIYIGIAFMFAMGIVVAFGVMLQAERSFGAWIAPMVVPVVAVGICVSTIFSGRSLKYASVDLSLQSAGVGSGGSWILRLLTVTLLAICSIAVVNRWIKRAVPLPPQARPLFLAFTAFFVSNSLLNSAFGTEPAFVHNLFYPIFIFACAYATCETPLARIIVLAKLSLISMMLISLAAAVAIPDLAIQPNYRGWIPGLNSRLWGIGSNANSIGPLALVCLLLEYLQPYRRWWIRWPAVLVTLVVFVYAQSKTVFAAAVVLAFILAWYRVGKSGKGIDLRFAIFLIFLACGLSAALLFLDLGRIWDRMQMTQAGTDIATLTGRWQIWTVAANEWLRNPLFGYGPEIWGPEFRQRIGMQFAFSAHNQFMQSLSGAGTLGFVSLVIYLGFLAVGAFKMSRQTRGVSVALYALILARCMTEAPLTLTTMFNGDFITHLLLFHMAVRYAIADPRLAAAEPLGRTPSVMPKLQGSVA